METERDYQDVLKDSLYLFSKYLVAEDFLDLLIKDNVLSLDDKELITNQFIHQTRRQRATKLVEILMTRGQQGYDIFIEYVEYLYPHVFTMVTKKEPRQPPPDLKRNRESDKLRLINELPNLAQQIKEQWHVNKELDTELTVLQHILEYAKEENVALEGELDSLKETRFDNEKLKLQVVSLEREKNELQVNINKEMLRTFDYIKERDEAQEKLRVLQVKYDDLYKQYREIENKSTSSTKANDGPKKPPLPERKPVEEKIKVHMDVAKKILMDELADYREKCEELSYKQQFNNSEIERLEKEVEKGENDLKKLQKESSTLQKHLNDVTVKCESYFAIIQKKDQDLLENQSQTMKEQMKLKELIQSKNELFETNHRLEMTVKNLQCELDRIKARQSSGSVDIDNSSSLNSASEDDSGEDKDLPGTRKPRRQLNIKKKMYGDELESPNLPDYYKASTMPASTSLNETPEMVFRRECAMFRYTMKKSKLKRTEEFGSSMTVEPSNSIKRHEDVIIPASLSFRKEPIVHPQDLETSSASTVLVPRAPNGKPDPPKTPPKPAYLQKIGKEKNLPRKTEKSSSQSEEDEPYESVTDSSNHGSTTTNDSNDSYLSSDFPSWEVSTHFLPKDCVRVNRPGIPDRNMCREITLKFPVLDDKISIKGGNHTGIYISKVLKACNISEGEEIKGIVYVPSQRNEETNTSLEGCTLEDTYKLLSDEYISKKKEREVKIRVKNCHQEYDSACKWMAKNSGTGDYIFVRCNTSVDGKSPNEVYLKQGEIYLITNTMVDHLKWLGKKINENTGELDSHEVMLPNLQQANIRRCPSTSPSTAENRRPVVKIRGQSYDRVLPMTAALKLPVYVIGPEKIVHAVIDTITSDLPSLFVRMQKDPEKRSSETLMHDVHYVTDGLSDTKSQSKSYGRIYILINVTSSLPDKTYINLFGAEFPVHNLDDPVSRSSRIKQHLVTNSINYENIVLDLIPSRDKLVTTVRQCVQSSQKRLIWLSVDEIDESTAKKYVKYLGQDLGQVMYKVQRANSTDQ